MMYDFVNKSREKTRKEKKWKIPLMIIVGCRMVLEFLEPGLEPEGIT